MRPAKRKTAFSALLAFLGVVLFPKSASAYVGPGAGVALVTTLGALIVAFVIGLVSILIWPFRWVYRAATRKRPPNPARIDRAVIIGLDGLDPDLTEDLMAQGRLPNLSRIAERGAFSKLGTTNPAMSPVAWSSFATGVHPEKHGIFDFLTRDPQSYLPDLSSASILPSKKNLRIGRLRIPLGKPDIRLLRKSTPFWKVLGRHGVPSSILRVPITFPPEKFYGHMLSAMCVPDLMGSQGTFTYFTSEPADERATGGQVVPVELVEGACEAALPGPENPIRADGEALAAPFSVRLGPELGQATLRIGGDKHTLKIGEYTDWVEVAFGMGLGLKLRGIARFRLLEAGPALRLYASPVNIDPARPIMPISQPAIFSIFLAKLIGRYATLGLAEDTWALNEGVLDEDAFLEQAWANHAEREAMLFEMLDRTDEGVITCVFDGTDRIQHMFMRYLDEGHPAAAGDPKREQYAGVIPDTYARMDEMLGRVLEKVDVDDPRTLLMVLSDHGFKTFRRGVNLNAWLKKEGYLVLKEGRQTSGNWFEGVDWTETTAFSLGLAGIFLNVRGREREGFVEPGRPAEIIAESIAERLAGLVDDEHGEVAVRRADAAHKIYSGPYRDRSPDVVVGFSPGYRASWSGVQGVVDDIIFDDNLKAWSGDHCMDPDMVPGVLVCNQDFTAGAEPHPSITDLAPTLLELFGVPKPRYMDGVSRA